MKSKIFEPLVKSWSARLTWSKADLTSATKLLVSISTANGGDIASDVEIDVGLENDFAIRRAVDALARRQLDTSSTAKVLASLRATLEDTKKNPFGVAKNLRYTRASTVIKDSQVRQKGLDLDQRRILGIEEGALLLDSDYIPFVKDLINRATSSICVMMFFIRFDEANPKYVINSLVASLIQARQRGLDVRVILDRDGEGDAAESHVINSAAFKQLTAGGVATLYDKVDRMTHSKLVIVDGKFTVLGSHNWTAGSSFAYDDTSICMTSVGLAREYLLEFDAFWASYTGGRPVRR